MSFPWIESWVTFAEEEFYDIAAAKHLNTTMPFNGNKKRSFVAKGYKASKGSAILKSRRNQSRVSYNRSEKEKKFHDVNSSLTVPTAGSIALSSLFVIPVGTTGITRIGRRINVTDIFIRISDLLVTTSTLTFTSDVYRFIVYLDTQANGATAAVTDILATAAERSFNNLNNVSRFRILADKRRVFSSTSGEVTGGFGENRKECFIAINNINLPIEYSGDDGAIDKIRSNNVGILVISEKARVSTFFRCRIRFTD